MIDLTTRAGCALHLAHATHELRPQQGPRRRAARADRRGARPRGVDISLDTYPYLPGATTLSAVLPSWSSAGGQDATLRRLHDPAALARIREDLEVNGSDGCHGVVAEWDTIEISGVTQPELGAAVGRTIAQLAADRRAASRSTCSSTSWSATTWAPASCSTSGTRRTCARSCVHSRHTGGSDGLLVGAKPHPRAWGTFPRYLGHYCRELGVFSLEECVGHLTGRAAARLRLADRGLVRPGYAADLVLFDPDTVADTATYAEPAPAGRRHPVRVRQRSGDRARRIDARPAAHRRDPPGALDAALIADRSDRSS